MFYGKKIKEIEKQCADFGRELTEVKEEVKRLKGILNLLAENNSITMFDTEEYITFLTEHEGGQERIDTILKMKEDYEKKLRKFVRSVVNKKKPNIKSLTNGKETSAATE